MNVLAVRRVEAATLEDEAVECNHLVMIGWAGLVKVYGLNCGPSKVDDDAQH